MCILHLLDAEQQQDMQKWLVVIFASNHRPKILKSGIFTLLIDCILFHLSDSLTVGTSFSRTSLDQVRNSGVILCFFAALFHIPISLPTSEQDPVILKFFFIQYIVENENVIK